MNKLSPEIVELVLEKTLENNNHSQNVSQLLKLQEISLFVLPVRRLLYQRIDIDFPTAALTLFETLKSSNILGSYVKYLTVDFGNLSDDEDRNPASAAIICLPALLRLLPNLVSFVGPNLSLDLIFAPSLRHFAGSYQDVKEDSDDGESSESDSDDQDDEEDLERLKLALKKIAYKNSQGVPLPFRKLYSLPNTLTSLVVSDVSTLAVTPTRSFPFNHLINIELLRVSITKELFKWMVTPSIRNRSLKRLKLWSVSGVDEDVILSVLESGGPRIEEFLYKADQSNNQTFANKAVQLLPSLKALTFGSDGTTVYDDVVFSNSISKLCLALPQNEYISLSAFTLRLLSGDLSNCRRFELYSQRYFPPSLDIQVLDDFISSSQLREVRLSHVSAKQKHFIRFFRALGAGITILALHRCNISFGALLPFIPFLKRLDLGYLLFSEDYKFDSPHLTHLKIHFRSGVNLLDLIEAIKFTLPSLQSFEITGLVPDDVPSEFTPKRMGELMELCRAKGIQFSLNGRTIETILDLWGSLLNHYHQTHRDRRGRFRY